uniref:IS4 family transposase n=1 Tax=Caballeronia choica TaxID=326476 RepID=UPI0035B51EEF
MLFESDEWRAAFILNKQKPPKTPRRPNEVVRVVARLGGFLDQGDGEPGVKAILQSLRPEPLDRYCSVRRQTFECSNAARQTR